MRVIFTQWNHILGRYQFPAHILYKTKKKNEYWVMIEFANGNTTWMDKESVEKFSQAFIDWRKVPTV